MPSAVRALNCETAGVTLPRIALTVAVASQTWPATG
ncbi:Uncharacterised protein [Mycobacterium tuberculosis]|uniref:Uncharacterized protein n=1 Tax=Mycobacterium tuberculosis TaxID=1773 RepID=A0A654ZYR9_MYCTX|nr:Uncharacterised protein [Mycobacterium tuberculosis]CKR78292.1 Uncharacterised protein [Mycobacterium tuberculosis]